MQAWRIYFEVCYPTLCFFFFLFYQLLSSFSFFLFLFFFSLFSSCATW